MSCSRRWPGVPECRGAWARAGVPAGTAVACRAEERVDPRGVSPGLTPDGRQRLVNQSPWDASPGAEPAPYFPGELTALEAEVLPLIT
jgi:hypothetical protein